MTIVPRTGPLSASSAFATTSWYQRGKSSACAVSTFAIGDGSYTRLPLPRPLGPRSDRPRPASGGAAGDGAADPVERAAVELVGHGRQLAGAAVGIAAGVPRPRDLDPPALDGNVVDRREQRAGNRAGRLGQARHMDRAPAALRPYAHGVLGAVGAVAADHVHHGLVVTVAVEVAVGDVGVDLEAGVAADVEDRAAAVGDRDGGRRREAEALGAGGPGRRHLSEVDGADVGPRVGGPRRRRGRGGGLRRPPTAGAGEHGGGEAQPSQPQPRGTESRRTAHDRRNLPKSIVSMWFQIWDYSLRSGGPISTNQATIANRPTNRSMRISEKTKPRTDETRNQTSRTASSTRPTRPSQPSLRRTCRAMTPPPPQSNLRMSSTRCSLWLTSSPWAPSNAARSRSASRRACSRVDRARSKAASRPWSLMNVAHSTSAPTI